MSTAMTLEVRWRFAFDPQPCQFGGGCDFLSTRSPFFSSARRSSEAGARRSSRLGLRVPFFCRLREVKMRTQAMLLCLFVFVCLFVCLVVWLVLFFCGGEGGRNACVFVLFCLGEGGWLKRRDTPTGSEIDGKHPSSDRCKRSEPIEPAS